jgi:hypothetical protein
VLTIRLDRLKIGLNGRSPLPIPAVLSVSSLRDRIGGSFQTAPLNTRFKFPAHDKTERDHQVNTPSVAYNGTCLSASLATRVLGIDQEKSLMKALNREMTQKMLFIVFGAWLSSLNPAWAETDKELQEKALKARELSQHGAIDHSAHAGTEAATGQFRGVFYGYLPCHEENCNGLKMTLSLNAKNNYLLVIQPAKPQNRESFEKGKYEWNETTGIVLLTPNKEAPQRWLAIKDEGTLLYLSNDGAPLPGDQDRYLLQRSDRAGNREMHIH